MCNCRQKIIDEFTNEARFEYTDVELQYELLSGKPYMLAKARFGKHRAKTHVLMFNFCPFCGEALQAKQESEG